MTSLEERVAIVTGGSRGMGRHFVDALVAAGARVGVLARASKELDACATRHGDAVCALPCEIGDPAAVRRSVAAVVERFGRLDILINNAASCSLMKVESAADDELRAELSTNLLGPILCIRECTPHMRAAGGGDIVNISSESVHLPFPFLTVYAATKAGLEALSAGLRAERRVSRCRTP